MPTQTLPAPGTVHEFTLKQFEGSRTRYAGCSGCSWVGPFVYDNTPEEREQLARTFTAKHRTTTPPAASETANTPKRNP